jgi:sec-independent protein translocase protein TatA
MMEGLLQPTHLLFILVIALFVFGPKKLPELGKGLAQGIRSFKDGVRLTDHPAAPESNEPKNPAPQEPNQSAMTSSFTRLTNQEFHV